MKLLAVLMLTALPLSCFAGSGCDLLEEVIDKTIQPNESRQEYQDFIRPYLSDEETANAMDDFKKCYLEQSDETLSKIDKMMHYIYNSPWCASY